MRESDLQRRDIARDLLRDGGQGLRDAVRRSCNDLLAAVFPGAWTPDLLTFAVPVATAAEIRGLVLTFAAGCGQAVAVGPGAAGRHLSASLVAATASSAMTSSAMTSSAPPSAAVMRLPPLPQSPSAAVAGLQKFRSAFHALVCRVDVNAALDEDTCKWLNDPSHNVLHPGATAEATTPAAAAAPASALAPVDVVGGASDVGGGSKDAGAAAVVSALQGDSPTKRGRPAACQFSPGVHTLFSVVVWLGDAFCVDLALALGAGSASGRPGARSAGAEVALTHSRRVQRCLRSSTWGQSVARGVDVQTQDCVPERMLGSGVKAHVFASTFRKQPCAIKQYDAFFKLLRPDDLALVLGEVQTLLRARHDHVVACYGFFLWDVQLPTTKPCVLLELLDVSAGTLLAKTRPARTGLPANRGAIAAMFTFLDSRLDVLRQVACGLAYLHGLTPAVVHRDVKPDNVLLVLRGGQLVAKLGDFGLSQFSGQYATVTRTNGALHLGAQVAGAGTPAFMSPEQWRGETTQSTKADVFAFGLTFFAVVCHTEQPWFDGQDYARVLAGDATRCVPNHRRRSC